MQINILEYLERTAERFPDKVAFVCDDESITFSELREQALRRCAGIAPYFQLGDPVLVVQEKSISTIISYLAILYAGGYYISVDSSLPASRLQSIGQMVGASLLLTDAVCAPFVPEKMAVNIMQASALDETPRDEKAERWHNACDMDAMYVIFTSGSTGTPKGVVTSHRAAIDYIEAFSEIAKVDDKDVFGNQAPLDYVAAIRDIYLPLKTGASTVLLPKKLFSFPGKLFDLLDEKKVNAICWVVSALSIPAKLNFLENRVPKYVKKIIFTGAVMPSKYLAMWQKAIPDALYINHYGPTEITASCTYTVIDHLVNENEVLPIGRPYRNTGILLLDDENRKIVNPGDVGEIYVRGCGLASGYFRDPERTAQSFIQNPTNPNYSDILYKTGDLAHFDHDGVLWFHGRKDNQIKFMGHRVELGEIEHTANQFPGLESCCCRYYADVEQICLFYESKTIDTRMLSAHLRKHLPAFMVPRKLFQLEKMPLLDNGKIDMQGLRAIMDSAKDRR